MLWNARERSRTHQGEPGWVLRRLERHCWLGDLLGSPMMMLCIGVCFTIRHDLIRLALRTGALCLTHPGPLDMPPLSDRTRPREKLKWVKLDWWVRDSPATLVWASAPGLSSEACIHALHILTFFRQEYPQGWVWIKHPPLLGGLCMALHSLLSKQASLLTIFLRSIACLIWACITFLEKYLLSYLSLPIECKPQEGRKLI